MKIIFDRALLLLAAIVCFSSPARAYTIDTSSASSPMTGLWNNQNESGWGASLTQQFGTIFATVYTYDANGNPVWYVASSCPVTGSGCEGDLYQVTGGSSLLVPWNGGNKVVNKVGSIQFNFIDANTGTMSYTINGVSNFKAISRQIFATAPTTGTGVCGAANFTREKYNAISVGMTISQVSQLIGCANTPSKTISVAQSLGLAWSYSTYTIWVYFEPTGSIVTEVSSGFYKQSFGF